MEKVHNYVLQAGLEYNLTALDQGLSFDTALWYDANTKGMTSHVLYKN